MTVIAGCLDIGQTIGEVASASKAKGGPNRAKKLLSRRAAWLGGCGIRIDVQEMDKPAIGYPGDFLSDTSGRLPGRETETCPEEEGFANRVFFRLVFLSFLLVSGQTFPRMSFLGRSAALAVLLVLQ